MRFLQSALTVSGEKESSLLEEIFVYLYAYAYYPNLNMDSDSLIFVKNVILGIFIAAPPSGEWECSYLSQGSAASDRQPP